MQFQNYCPSGRSGPRSGEFRCVVPISRQTDPLHSDLAPEVITAKANHGSGRLSASPLQSKAYLELVPLIEKCLHVTIELLFDDSRLIFQGYGSAGRNQNSRAGTIDQFRWNPCKTRIGISSIGAIKYHGTGRAIPQLYQADNGEPCPVRTFRRTSTNDIFKSVGGDLKRIGNSGTPL